MSPLSQKSLSIFFFILAIIQIDHTVKVFDFDIFGGNSSSDGIICHEIEGKPVFGF